MSKLRGALKPRKEADDEYYTSYEEVEDIFKNYIPKAEIKDKIIYCPCDSDASNFVIYLKEHKEELQYKELIYTWDDFNTHLDLFEKCDIIITNPPFSKLVKEFIPILNKVNKKFFIFGAVCAIHNYFNLFGNDVHFQKAYLKSYFLRPDNTFVGMHHVYIYNLNDVKINYIEKALIFKNPKVPIKAYDDAGNIYFNYDKLENVQKGIKEIIMCPVTILYENNRQYVDVLRIKWPKGCRYEDGRNRFVRLFCKIKNT